MRNLTMTLPPPPPPPSSLPLFSQLLLHIKAHLCHIKAERQKGVFYEEAAQRILGNFLQLKSNQLPISAKENESVLGPVGTEGCC